MCIMVSRNAVVLFMEDIFLPHFFILNKPFCSLILMHVECKNSTFALLPPEAETETELAAVYYDDNLYHTTLFFPIHRREEG